MQRFPSIVLWLGLALLAIALPGCNRVTDRRMTLANEDPDQVWNAMVAIAQAPEYARDPDPAKRWQIRRNDVWIDADARRIEIDRHLERELHQPLSPARHEERRWKFNIMLESRDPPSMLFRVRNAAVPAHAWEEADRYFREVREFLRLPPSE